VLPDDQVKFLASRVRRWSTPQYNYYTRRENPEKLLAGTKQKYKWLIPFVRELHRADVPLITGTDSSIPGALPGASMFEEFADLESSGLRAVEILQTATLNPALFLKKHTSHAASGRVRKGFAADLLLLDKNPLDHLSELDQIMIGVIFNGRYATKTELRKLLIGQTK
jgi:imidazolonepropionase-like amidohydrolase